MTSEQGKTYLRLPMRTEPWPMTQHNARPCPVCGGSWVPWPRSYLPCHGRCVLSDEALDLILHSDASHKELAKFFGVPESMIRTTYNSKRMNKRRRLWQMKPTVRKPDGT